MIGFADLIFRPLGGTYSPPGRRPGERMSSNPAALLPGLGPGFTPVHPLHLRRCRLRAGPQRHWDQSGGESSCRSGFPALASCSVRGRLRWLLRLPTIRRRRLGTACISPAPAFDNRADATPNQEHRDGTRKHESTESMHPVRREIFQWEVQQQAADHSCQTDPWTPSFVHRFPLPRLLSAVSSDRCSGVLVEPAGQL